MRVLFLAAAMASMTAVASAQTTSPVAESFNYVLGIQTIGNRGVKQPASYTLQRFYVKSKAFIAVFEKEHERSPKPTEFGDQAVRILESVTDKTR